jgi:hypothetical protein
MADPVKPAFVRDRDDEWRRLAGAWASERPEVVFVIGRRRVGKSFLLAPFASAVEGIYYQATRRTESEQLRSLARIAGERLGDAALQRGASLPDWEALFELLLDRAGSDRFLVAIDEFPYLEAASPALPSVLQSLIDHRFPGSRLKLVLSGSHVSAMKRLQEADQPLYARRTERVVLSPFSYLDAAAFVPAYTPQDRIRAYGIFGGLPGHLSLLDPGEELAVNVQRQMLDSGARLYDEAQRLLDAFLGDAEIHYSIIEAVAAGKRAWSGISSRVGKSSGSLSRPMAWLIDMEMVRRDVPMTVGRPSRSKRAVYTLTDPYLAFWHQFVSPLIQAGVPDTASPERMWKGSIRPRLDAYMGPVFEEVCRQAVHARPNLFPFEPYRIGSWWSADAREQVDVVAVSEAGDLLVGECKWGAVGGADLHALERRAKLITAEMRTDASVHLALFSGSGRADAAVREAAARGLVLFLSAEHLFG